MRVPGASALTLTLQMGKGQFCSKYAQRIVCAHASPEALLGLLRGSAAIKQRTYGRQQRQSDKWLLQIDAVGNKGCSLPYAVLVLRSDEDRRRGQYGRGEMIE